MKMQHCDGEDLAVSSSSSSTSGTDLEDDSFDDEENSSTTSLLSHSSFRKQEKEKETVPEMSYELHQGFRILKELMAEINKKTNQYFMNSIESNGEDIEDYLKVIKQPMWLKKIKLKFFQQKYSNISEFVSDMRLMLENCYRYYGPHHAVTKKGIRLEVMMEQKLALLPRELREKTTLEITSKELLSKCEEKTFKGRSSHLHPGESSLILNFVKHEKALRDKQIRKKQMEDRRIEREEKEKEIVEWEEQLCKEPFRTEMEKSWEIPQIAQFLYLCSSVFQFPTVSIYELERILLMPRESSLLPKIIGSLLSSPDEATPVKKSSVPYKTWTEKLKLTVEEWYSLYRNENSLEAVFNQIGLESPFFQVLGDVNPLLTKEFHDISFRQRIWILKTLCDNFLHTYSHIQDVILQQPVEFQRETCLGTDTNGNNYLYFPHFSEHCLRIYRQGRWNGMISPLKAKSSKKDTLNHSSVLQKENIDSKQCISSDKNKLNCKTDTEGNEDSFELIVDSIHSLRKLIKDFESKDLPRLRITKNAEQEEISNEKSLLQALRKLLKDIERDETKMQTSVQRLRQKLYKEWNDFKVKSMTPKVKKTSKQWLGNENGTSLDKHKLPKNRTNGVIDNDDSSSDSEEDSNDVILFKQTKSCKRKADVLQSKKNSASENSKHDGNLNRSNGPSSRAYQMKRHKQDAILANGATKGLLMTHLKQNTALQAKQLFAWETLRQNLVSSQSAGLQRPFFKPNSSISFEKSSAESSVNAQKQAINEMFRKNITSSLFNKTYLKLNNTGSLLQENLHSNSNESFNLSNNISSVENASVSAASTKMKTVQNLTANSLQTIVTSKAETKPLVNYKYVIQNPSSLHSGNATSKNNLLSTTIDKMLSQNKFPSPRSDLASETLCSESTQVLSCDPKPTINTSLNSQASIINQDTLTLNAGPNKQVILLQANPASLNRTSSSQMTSSNGQILHNVCTSNGKLQNGVLLLSGINQNGKPIYLKIPPQPTQQSVNCNLPPANTSVNSRTNAVVMDMPVISNFTPTVNVNTLKQPMHSTCKEPTSGGSLLKTVSNNSLIINPDGNLIPTPIKKLTLVPQTPGGQTLQNNLHNINSIFIANSGSRAQNGSSNTPALTSTVQSKTMPGITSNMSPMFIQNTSPLPSNHLARKDTVLIISYPSQLNTTLKQTPQPQANAPASLLKPDSIPVTILR